MRRNIFVGLVIGFILVLLSNICLAISLFPVADLSDWGEFQAKENNPVSITRTEGTVQLVADGEADYAWGSIYKIYPGSIGIIAQVNVSRASGNVAMGIRKYIATTESGSRLSAEMQVVRWNDSYKIEYYLKEKDSSGNIIRQLGAGTYGEWASGEANEWSLGQDVFLGLALVGNEVWFYSPGYGILAKVQILSPFTPSDDYIQVNAYAQYGTGNHIEGSVKDISIVYP